MRDLGIFQLCRTQKVGISHLARPEFRYRTNRLRKKRKEKKERKKGKKLVSPKFRVKGTRWNGAAYHSNGTYQGDRGCLFLFQGSLDSIGKSHSSQAPPPRIWLGRKYEADDARNDGFGPTLEGTVYCGSGWVQARVAWYPIQAPLLLSVGPLRNLPKNLLLTSSFCLLASACRRDGGPLSRCH